MKTNLKYGTLADVPHLQYSSWDNVSISLYKQIVEVLKEDNVTDIEKELSLVSLLSDLTEDEVWSLSVTDARALIAQLNFISEFRFDQKWHGKHLTLNGIKYDVCVDMTKFTVAQYVDFQQYWSKKDNVEYLHKLLSVFLTPHGCQYNEGYDMAEVQTNILEHCPITVANSLLFFFLKESVKSMKAIQICLEFQMKRMMKKKKVSPEVKKKLEEMMEQIKSMDGLLS